MNIVNDYLNIAIPEARKATYINMNGKDIIFGIRPENVHNPEFCPQGIVAAPISAKVDVTELMGNEIFVYLIAGGTQFVARVDPRSRYIIGQDIQLVLDMTNFHVFDPSEDQENPIAIR